MSRRSHASAPSRAAAATATAIIGPPDTPASEHTATAIPTPIPTSATLAPGQTLQVGATGYDQQNRPMAMAPVWSVPTGGTTWDGFAYGPGADSTTLVCTAFNDFVGMTATLAVTSEEAAVCRTILVDRADALMLTCTPP